MNWSHSLISQDSVLRPFSLALCTLGTCYHDRGTVASFVVAPNSQIRKSSMTPTSTSLLLHLCQKGICLVYCPNGVLR